MEILLIVVPMIYLFFGEYGRLSFKPEIPGISLPGCNAEDGGL